MFVVTVTSDSPQSGATSALVRLGADFAAVGRRTLLLDVLPRTDIATHLGLPPDAPRAGPRQVGPSFIYAGLDATACSHDALAASEADVVVADIGVLGGLEAQTFLRQVPASVLVCLRSSVGLATSYANAMNGFNGLVSSGGSLRSLGVVVTRHNPADLAAARALATLTGTTDLLCAPVPEAVGLAGPALVGSGMGEVYRGLAETARSASLDQQRQGTPVKVGLGDLATAYQQSGKQIEKQTAFGSFPSDGGESASQYTYVLDSQALADVVGENAAPIVQLAAEDPEPAPTLSASLAPSHAAQAVDLEESHVLDAPPRSELETHGAVDEHEEGEIREVAALRKANRSRLLIAGALVAAVLLGIVVLSVSGGNDTAATAEKTTLAETRTTVVDAPSKAPPVEKSEAEAPTPRTKPTSEVDESADETKVEPRRKNRRKRRARREGAE